LNMNQYIYNCDSYHFFQEVGGLVKTGPTQTNVMDLMVVLISRQ
jgi:glycerate-2-kinase